MMGTNAEREQGVKPGKKKLEKLGLGLTLKK